MARTTTWKSIERKVCKALGLTRSGNLGRAAPDGYGDWLIVEVKHRRVLPAWILSALATAKAHAGTSKLGVAVLHEHGQLIDDSLIVMTLGDFRSRFVDGGSDERD